MSNLKTIESPEFHRFRGYLNAIQDFTSGGNYEAWFDVYVYELSNSILAADELLKTAYPEEHFDSSKIIKCSAQSMMDTVNEALKLSTWSFSDQSVSWDNSEYIVRYNLAGFWEHLKALIDIGSAKIFKYDDEFSDKVYVYWWFTYVICNEQQRRCVVFHGGSSD